MSSAVKVAYGTATTLTITNANLATSATAGWKSAAIDNTTNLYLDYLVRIRLAAVNTAPANSKAIFLFVAGLVDDTGTNYDSTGSASPDGSEGTITFPDITANPVVMPRLGEVPYPTQNVTINSKEFSVLAAFGGLILPPKFCLGMINHSGMTLSVTAIEVRGIYRNVG